VTHEQYEEFAALAEKAGKTVSAYARDMLLGGADVDLHEAVAKLKRNQAILIKRVKKLERG
jgi:hypothetical protein